MLVVATAQSQTSVLITDVSTAPSSTPVSVNAHSDSMAISVMNTSETVTLEIAHSALMLITAVNVLTMLP